MCAYRIRGKGCAYDNLAVGSATGRERIISGQAATSEKYGAGSNLANGNVTATTWATTDLHENLAVGDVAPQRDNPATTPESS